MHYIKAIGMGSLALVSFVQICPAPWEAIAPLLGGVLAGSISGGLGKTRRDFTGDFTNEFVERGLPAGVSQAAFDQCKSEINAQGPGNPVKVYSTGSRCMFFFILLVDTL